MRFGFLEKPIRRIDFFLWDHCFQLSFSWKLALRFKDELFRIIDLRVRGWQIDFINLLDLFLVTKVKSKLLENFHFLLIDFNSSESFFQ